MKLFLIYIILLFLCLVMNSGGCQTFPKEEVSTETVVPKTLISSKFPAGIAGNNWLRSYFLMLKVLSPVKQLDLPGDYNKSWSITCKSLRSARKAILQIRQRICYTSEYMRLLSARHTNGFYVYSLRKLIL